MEAETSKQFPRVGKEEPPLEEGDIMSLILALRGLKPVEDKSLVVRRQEVPIEEIVDEIKNILRTSDKINFLEFLKSKNDVAIAVAYFFGMLEIVKMGYARAEQNALFGEIYLYAGENV
jgi:chromatin segregation and condensation protein Rec8/ScpA/Scc1 (kleisin family)